MHYVVRVEVVKTLRHAPQLQFSGLEQDGNSSNEPAHQANPIYLWVYSHVFDYPAVFHPIVNDVERRYLGRDSEERGGVRVP